MTKRKYLATVLIGLMTVSLTLAGCSTSKPVSSDASQKPVSSGAPEIKKEAQTLAKKEGNKLTIAVADNFISMDPHDTNDTLSGSAQATMFEGLLGFDKDMKMIPVLAESYEASADAKVFTFKLRKGVKFHDGTPFNADAAKANFDRVSNPDNKLKRYSLFALIVKTEAVDEYTFRVTLKEPFGAMLNNFAHPAARIISPKALATYGKDVSKHPIGTGPFKFVEWDPSDHLMVEKNPDYWQKGLPKVDGIKFKPVPENGSRVAMLQTGEVDFIYPFPSDQAQAISGKDGIVVENKPSIIARYVAMNTTKKPFNDVRVRQAINYAINKEAFLKVVFRGYGSVLDSIIPPGLQFYSKQTPYAYNLEKAKQLLKEAGYENGFETQIWGANNSTAMKAMEFLQQQLAQVGIKVKVVPMESGTLSSKIWNVKDPKDAEIELYYGGWSSSTGDADWGIRPLLAGESVPPKSYNTAYYTNEKADQLISAGLNTADPEKRKATYAEVQKMIWQDAPWAGLIVEDTLAGRKNYLDGVYLIPDGALSVKEAEIKH
ncbi:glutathione ABC transporter substrate-binding protein [Paenibacillus sp. GP183]|uniref:glutathione ABC transporter substrate-binding protein n=1 Tax=Paenibacillus sp. GP183 TaxID=1882751 RepID=UPI00089D7490|nr:glutathione ABC transporter substrate-binding protein [Paenibacillus sp. GP183]SEC14003.1 glutathione transport system substrate-binding protein [Paenibacillus sp. GP183]